MLSCLLLTKSALCWILWVYLLRFRNKLVAPEKILQGAELIIYIVRQMACCGGIADSWVDASPTLFHMAVCVDNSLPHWSRITQASLSSAMVDASLFEGPAMPLVKDQGYVDRDTCSQTQLEQ